MSGLAKAMKEYAPAKPAEQDEGIPDALDSDALCAKQAGFSDVGAWRMWLWAKGKLAEAETGPIQKPVKPVDPMYGPGDKPVHGYWITKSRRMAE